MGDRAVMGGIEKRSFLNRMGDINVFKKTLHDLDPRLSRVFVPWALRHPKYLPSLVRLARSLKRSESVRKNAIAGGLQVPPFLILSITSRCNLHCEGCFAAATGTIPNGNSGLNNHQLSWKQWRDIIQEASDLGVFSFVIAGGEPFLFPRLIELCQEFKDRLFLVLTNGTALNDEHYKQLKKTRNMVIIVSVEGGAEITDARRGHGVYERALGTIERLNMIGVLTGISVTITRLNYEYWMDEAHLDSFIEKDVRIGSFLEYIPLTPVKDAPTDGPSAFCTSIPESVEIKTDWNNGNDHSLMLTPKERRRFRGRVLEFRSRKSIYLIHSPGDEEYFGGCVSAGRGFAHITPGGDLTPCPVSNIATHNLVKSSLRDGLASPLFKEICKNEHLLETEGMPCALFAHPKEVDELARSVGAYRTG